MIIKDSCIKVNMKEGTMKVVTDFNDLVIYDLTNYPNTLVNRRIERIVPK